MTERGAIFFDKAEERLAGAESGFVNDRYSISANRAYYFEQPRRI